MAGAPQRGPLRLMELPHEIILKVIDEVILDDRRYGHDHDRSRSASYALSRTSAYWREEVEKRHKELYLATSLFPGFARWSLHSDWLFKKDRFKPSRTPVPRSTRDSESTLRKPRPKTQASPILLNVVEGAKPESSDDLRVNSPEVVIPMTRDVSLDSGRSDSFETRSETEVASASSELGLRSPKADERGASFSSPICMLPIEITMSNQRLGTLQPPERMRQTEQQETTQAVLANPTTEGLAPERLQAWP